MKPIVAIVGRPNVGKSTLFNRIVGGHRAITLDEPGVTRDRHYGHAQWDGREFVLIDTGGLFLDEVEGIEAKIRQQVETAIHESSVILFLMDGQSGLVPGEREIADRLRRSGKPVLFLVNKIDDPKHQERVAEFYQLGNEVYPVSAEHGTWVNDLLDRVVEKLPPEESGEVKEGKRAIRIAVIGRPNVGKSSLLNRVLGEERLIVHNEPGTTRDSIDTHIHRQDQDYILIDTAGIRRKGKWASKVERYSVLNALKSVERADICVMVLDAAEGIHKQDAHVAGYAAEAKKGILILWNKWDLIQLKGSKKEKEFLRMVRDQLKFLAHTPVHFVSAKTGEGCDAIWDQVSHLYAVCGKRVATSDVNRAFEGLIESHNPPVYKGKPVKFFYATQTQAYPPTFVVFVNEPDGVHFSFKRYLQNGFRKAFGFDGAPLEIVFRRKR